MKTTFEKKIIVLKYGVEDKMRIKKTLNEKSRVKE